MERFKFKRLNEPYFKSGTGLEIALPLALSGAGIAASVYSSSKANSMQQAMNDKVMDWQSEEAEKARFYNTGEREAAQAYQSGQLNNLMQFQQQMQDPQYQSSRLRAAGINPAVYFSQHGTFAGGSAPGAPSAPQGASSPMPGASPSMHPVVPDWASSMAVGANISKTLAESGHSKADTDLILQKVYGEELVNQGREFELSLKKLKAPADVQRAYQEVMVLQAQEFMLLQQGKEFEKRGELDAAQAKIQEFLGNKASAEAAYAQEQMNDMIQTRNARLGLLRSESNKNNAQAEESRANASLTSYQESMARAMEAGNLEMFNDALIKSYNDAEISGAQYEEAKALAEIQKTAASHAEAEFWKNYILDFVGGAVDAVTSWRNSNSWKRLSNVEQQRVRNRMYEIKQKYGDQVELTDMWNGMKRKRVYHSGRSKYGD